MPRAAGDFTLVPVGSFETRELGERLLPLRARALQLRSADLIGRSEGKAVDNRIAQDAPAPQP